MGSFCAAENEHAPIVNPPLKNSCTLDYHVFNTHTAVPININIANMIQS